MKAVKGSPCSIEGRVFSCGEKLPKIRRQPPKGVSFGIDLAKIA